MFLLCSREARVDAISDAHAQGAHVICHHTVSHIHTANISIPNQTLVSGPSAALKKNSKETDQQKLIAAERKVSMHEAASYT